MKLSQTDVWSADFETTSNPEKEAELIASTPGSSVWIMKISMMIFPLICILVGFILYMKKFKIDEKMYATIVSDLESRAKESEENHEIQA